MTKNLLIDDNDLNIETYNLVDVFVHRSSSMRVVYGWRQGIREGEKGCLGGCLGQITWALPSSVVRPN